MTLGLAIPSFTPHAISVSLPTWSDNIAYEEGDKRVVDALITGYPRFFIHRSVQKVGFNSTLYMTQTLKDHTARSDSRTEVWRCRGELHDISHQEDRG
jgi:hypothetical protein